LVSGFDAKQFRVSLTEVKGFGLNFRIQVWGLGFEIQSLRSMNWGLEKEEKRREEKRREEKRREKRREEKRREEKREEKRKNEKRKNEKRREKRREKKRKEMTE